MKKHPVFLFFILVIFGLFGEEPEYKGIHQIEWEAHRNDPGHTYFAKPAAVSVDPLQPRDPALTHAVFGYLPDWNRNTAPQYFDYDVLTHIALFDFTVSTNGIISGYPAGWPNDWINTMNTAHAHGVKLIMCVVEFNADDIHALINSSSASQTFYAEVASIIRQYDLDGVNIDFEAPKTADRGAPMNNFVRGLTDYIHTEVGPEQEVSFAGPAVNWSGWDLRGLVNACDYVFIMGYAYWYNGSPTTGPCAPIGGSTYNLVQTLVSNDRGYGNCDPSKLILGLPYYGNRWEVSESQKDVENASTLGSGSSVFYYSAKGLFETQGKIRSERYEDTWTYYQSEGKWYQAWCNDAISLDAKEKLVFSHRLMGTGMWALGYDSNNPELWQILRNNFLQEDSLLIDNFEEGFDHFYRAPSYSGSSRGIHSDSYIDTVSSGAFQGERALKICLKDDPASAEDWQVRLLSGSGAPENNVYLLPDREIVLSLKTDQPGLGVALLIDDKGGRETELSLAQALIADGEWHSYVFDLRPAADWQPYSAGNGSIDAANITIDGIYFRAEEQTEDRVIYLDALRSNKRKDPLYFTLSGYVRSGGNGIPDVLIADTLSNGAGYFERSYPWGGSLLLRPEKPDWIFSPESHFIGRVNRDSTLNFAAIYTDTVLLPGDYRLSQNYPNPFNARTTLRYRIPTPGRVRIAVYDLSGKFVCDLVNRQHATGDFQSYWDAGSAAAGLYVAVLEIDGRIRASRKMLPLK
ncbi:MAG: glycosyl hydrolase family 18 protein [Candidatus Neomarinimicrobiota bacterium]